MYVVMVEDIYLKGQSSVDFESQKFLEMKSLSWYYGTGNLYKLHCQGLRWPNVLNRVSNLCTLTTMRVYINTKFVTMYFRAFALSSAKTIIQS